MQTKKDLPGKALHRVDYAGTSTLNKNLSELQHHSLSERPDQMSGALDSGKAARSVLLSAHWGAVYRYKERLFT